MKFLPSLRWEDIQASEAAELDLSPMTAWRVLLLEWFGHGVVICAKERP